MIRKITHALFATVLVSSFATGCMLDTEEVGEEDSIESQTDEIQGQNAKPDNGSYQNANTCQLEVVITDACHDEAYFEAVAADICAQSNLTLGALGLYQSCAWAGNAYAHLYAEARFECCPVTCSNADPNCIP